MGRDVRVGAHDLDHPGDAVSAWHYRTFGELPPSTEAEPAGPRLRALVDRFS
jgi:hypothetical protein